MNRITCAALVAATSLVLPVSSALADRIFDFGSPTYVSADTNPTRSNSGAVSTDGFQSRFMFFDINNPVNTAAGYTGPAYYGGYSVIGSQPNNGGAVISLNRALQVRDRAAPTNDGISFTSSDSTSGYVVGNNYSHAAAVLFKQPSFTSGFNSGNVTLTGLGYGANPDGALTGTQTNSNNGRSGKFRWLVIDSGQVYVSTNAGSGSITSQTFGVTGSNFSAITWAPYQPIDGLFDAPTTGYAAKTFYNVQGVGVLFTANGVFGSTDGVGALAAWEFRDMHADGIATSTITYTGTSGGSWTSGGGWGGTPYFPTGTDKTVVLGSSITSKASISLDSDITLGTLRFNNASQSYNVAGLGNLSFAVSSGTPLIDVVAGSHFIGAPTTLGATNINFASASSLKFYNQLTLTAGTTVALSGSGTLTIAAPVAVSGSGAATIKINTGTTLNFDLANSLGNVNVKVDPATLNIGAAQTFGALSLDLGGNTLNVGQTSGGLQTNATLTASSLAVTGGTGNTINTVGTANKLTVTGALSVSSGSAVTKTGSGNVTAGSLALDGSYSNSAGSTTFGNVTGTGSLSVPSGSATAGRVLGANVAIGSTGSLTLSNGSGVSVLSSLLVASGGTFNVGNNPVVVHNGDAATLNSLVNSFETSGTGLGYSGLASNMTLAVFSNAAAAGINYFNSFGNDVTLASTDVLLVPTYKADLNLDGKVDGKDFKLVMEGAVFGLSGWLNGDINHDGAVNAADLSIFSPIYATAASLPTLSGMPSLDTISGTATVPEPTKLGLFVPFFGMLSRRRR
jgi:hypothetical protein